MLCQMRRGFTLILKITSAQKQLISNKPLSPQYRMLFSQSGLQRPTIITNDLDKNAAPVGFDPDYTQSYCADYERGTRASVLADALRQRFRLNTAETLKVMSNEIVHRTYRERALIRNIDTLILEGISRKSLIEYPWLLTLDFSRLEQKIYLIKRMKIRDINHFVPFFRLTLPRLRKLLTTLNKEAHRISSENRVYYISDKLQIEPAIVTKYLCKRLFVLEMPYDVFEKNLQYMIDYNVTPINILKDLWVFRYTPKLVQLRLERVKRAKKDKIMPWMVRCPEPILERSLKLTRDELEVLGKFSNVVEYVADRLRFNVSETKAILDKHPQTFTVRVTKIKEVIDYLLYEAGFSRFDIAQVPRILCHSLKTTKERLRELETLGCRPTSLVIVCRSKREYAKFLKHWQSMSLPEKTVAVTS